MKRFYGFIIIVALLLGARAEAQTGVGIGATFSVVNGVLQLPSPAGPGFVWAVIANDTINTVAGQDLIYTVPAGRVCAGFSWYILMKDTGSGSSSANVVLKLGTTAGSYHDFDNGTTIGKADADAHGQFVYGPGPSDHMGLIGSPGTPAYASAGTGIYVNRPIITGRYIVSIVFIGILL